MGFSQLLRSKNAGILDSIRSSNDLTNDVEAKLKAAVEAYAGTFA